MIEVLEPGPLTTVQDLGRPGYAALGVGNSGAADRRSFALANRVVGNFRDAAALETTFGGLRLRFHVRADITVTGAPLTVYVNGRAYGPGAPVPVPAGATVRLGTPTTGLRSYLAVRGGVDVPAVLGSRATDLLSGTGPEPLRKGDLLPVGTALQEWPGVDLAPVRPLPDVPVLRVLPGPRADWFTEEAFGVLASAEYTVTAQSNRIGVRLDGPPLDRRRGELPSEGMVLGALQVPPDGLPVLFLADHPVTGGYPVVGVVASADVDLAAQAVPGQRIRFRLIA